MDALAMFEDGAGSWLRRTLPWRRLLLGDLVANDANISGRSGRDRFLPRRSHTEIAEAGVADDLLGDGPRDGGAPTDCSRRTGLGNCDGNAMKDAFFG